MQNVLDLPWKMQKHKPTIHAIDLNILFDDVWILSHSDEDRLVGHISACFSLFGLPLDQTIYVLFLSRLPMYLWSSRSISFLSSGSCLPTTHFCLIRDWVIFFSFFLLLFSRPPPCSISQTLCMYVTKFVRCALALRHVHCADFCVRASLLSSLCSMVWSESRKAQFSLA